MPLKLETVTTKKSMKYILIALEYDWFKDDSTGHKNKATILNR